MHSLAVLTTLSVNLQDHYLKQKQLNNHNWLSLSLIGKHENGNEMYLKNGRFGPYIQYEIIPESY